MSNIDTLIKQHFPFKSFNEGQYDLILRSISALLDGKRHVIIEAPTGIGKSAVATTIHRVLKSYNPGFRTTIITATKGLQEQYVEDDDEIITLMGRANYKCPQAVGPYGSAKCKQLVGEQLCNKKVVCPYFKARERWRFDAHLRITNMAFQITAPHTLIGEDESRSDLLVIDECHVVDEQLVDNAKLIVDMASLSHLDKVAGKGFSGYFAEFINAFVDHSNGEVLTPSNDMKIAAVNLTSRLSVKIEELRSKAAGLVGAAESAVLTAIDELDQIYTSLSDFHTAAGEWIVNEFAYSTKVEVQPVYAYQVVRNGLYNKSSQFIHMSATICGEDEYMRNMGIDPSEAEFIRAKNPIPKEQRVVLGMNLMKVSQDYDRVRLAMFVDKIIKRHPNQNGVIHTVSFKLAEEIKEFSEFADRMIVSNNRDEIMEYLASTNSIVLSPSVEEGYDFKGDLARWQIIAKVPFEYLGSPWVKLNADRSKEWYARKAIVRTVQAAGRAVRGPDDFATTYIIDDNFKRLIERNDKLVPPWFKEALTMR